MLKTSILLADDHAIVRTGLRYLLEQERTTRWWPRPMTAVRPRGSPPS